MAFIELKNVYKVYNNGVSALADVNLEIEKNEFVFIIGESGSGKSTLIKLLYREEKPNKGTVFVGGINVSKLRNGNVYKLRRKVGVVFQDFKLLPKLTVYENIAYPLESYGMDSKEIREKVLDAVKRVGLKNKLRSYPNQLSGGEQQRVCIARAIVNKPKLIICDEPTGDLDPKMSREIMDVLEKINEEMGSTIIMATHDREIVDRMKKRVVTIHGGVVVSDKEKGSYIEHEDN
ncbi:MAG TPA: cell division ATP-binding protein FtsE [Bacilli bacterium]|nr:cell division ATP-binding protein FtsE [Bacilli bacterium]HPZ23728.1 cell division ATP-binding protein FtsE [Bacilli bacterium]HQC83765.1 cell division ATP-binding protein FtsE [Bacilli bacterium]